MVEVKISVAIDRTEADVADPLITRHDGAVGDLTETSCTFPSFAFADKVSARFTVTLPPFATLGRDLRLMGFVIGMETDSTPGCETTLRLGAGVEVVRGSADAAMGTSPPTSPGPFGVHPFDN